MALDLKKRIQIIRATKETKPVRVVAIRLRTSTIIFWKRFAILTCGVGVGFAFYTLFQHSKFAAPLALFVQRAWELAGEAGAEAWDDYVR